MMVPDWSEEEKRNTAHLGKSDKFKVNFNLVLSFTHTGSLCSQQTLPDQMDHFRADDFDDNQREKKEQEKQSVNLRN